MNRISWQLRYWISQLSREGRLGLSLLGISLVIYLLVFIPGQSQVTQFQNEIASLTSASSARVKLALPTTTDQLTAFYRNFPPQRSAPDWLDKIYHAARHENLALNEGKYRAKHQHNGSLIRYKISLPVTGSYRQIQHFLATVMEGIPSVALDGVTFERNKIGDTNVNAKIKLSLYLVQQS